MDEPNLINGIDTFSTSGMTAFMQTMQAAKVKG